MMNNLVFISHSSSKTPGALDDAEKLRHALLQAGFDAQLDVLDIPGGEDWLNAIDTWMARCSSAILLISPQAIKSRWVRSEVANLSWRKRLDPDLTLIPVLIRGATREQLFAVEEFAPLQLNARQCIEAADAESSAPQVLEALGTPAPPVPSTQDKVVDKLADPLSRMTEIGFSNTFDALGIPMPPWKPSTRSETERARALARRLLTLGVFELDRIVNALGSAVDDHAKDVICRILSAFWVDEKAARHIPDACKRQPSAWAVALNGNYLPYFTADAYARRAFWPDNQWHLIPVEGGAGTDYVRHVESSILDWVRRKQRNPEGWLKQTKNFVLVLLPDRQLVDQQALLELRKRFPRITFILGTGEKLHDLTGDGYSEVIPVLPALDLDEENEAQRAFNDAIAMLERSRSLP